MATELKSKTVFSVADAAEDIGVTVGRIRQILCAHNDNDRLATKLGRDWIITPRQLLNLKKQHAELFRKKFGRNPD